MTVPFDVGYMNTRKMAEWDGSNEQAIVDWLNTGVSDANKKVTITSETATELTLTNPSGAGGAAVVVPLNGWVSPKDVVPVLGGPYGTVQLRNSAQYWLSDQYGRPTTASDIETP